MNRTYTARLLIVVSLIVLSVAAYVWLADGEYEETRVFDPDNRQLRLERMHISEQWLRQQSRAVEVVQTLQFLDSLPAAGQHLIIPAALGDMSLLDASQLQDWVLRGGHLVAVAPNVLTEDDQPFDINPFDVTNCFNCLQRNDEQSDLENEQENDQFKNRAAADGDGIERVTIKGLTDQTLRLWSQFALNIETPSDKLEQWRSTRGDPMLVRYAFGAGRVTLMPANQWLDNAQMIEPDHARLLTALVAEPQGTIFLQHYSIPGGLLPWLWQKAPAFWLALIGLVALGIWHRLPRLGPIQSDPEPQPNQLRERLRANARFDAKHTDGQSLIKAMREELAVRALRRYPDWHQLSPSQRNERLAKLVPALSPEAIGEILTRDRIEPADRLIDYLTVQRQLLHAL